MIEKDIMICGIDEVGRGPLAGPVTAAAVVLPRFSADSRSSQRLRDLADSKKISEAKRWKAEKMLKEIGAIWALGWVSADEIDALNIHHATLLAMKRAFSILNRRALKKALLISKALIDGKFAPPLSIPTLCIIKGDEFIACIQAASIVAKNARDTFMRRIGITHPRYDFGAHKGYPTLDHRREILQYGCSPFHRRSFRLGPSPLHDQ